MKRVNVHLSEKPIQALKALAQSTDIKVTEHIRRAIDKYLKSQKRTQ